MESVPLRRIRAWAEAENEKLLATDPRFRRTVQVTHSEGSVFHLRNAFLLEVDGKWIVAFSEHQGVFAWDRDDLDHWTQFVEQPMVNRQAVPIERGFT